MTSAYSGRAERKRNDGSNERRASLVQPRMDDPKMQPALEQEEEEKEVVKRSGPESVVLHEAMALKGEHELDRPAASLFWSGLAAGIAISISIVAGGALHQRLPDAPWRELVTGWGYAVGFILVIMGRLQLFTEHTVVAVTPALATPTALNFQKLARLWIIVFVANQLGAFLAALAFAKIGVTGPELTDAMVEVSKFGSDRSFAQMLLQAIPAGFLIAAIAWLIIAAKTGHFWVIALLAYMIAIGQFPHVIASACGAYLLALTGNAPPLWPITGFVIPALIGNVIGGTGLFAMLSYAQIKEEI
jgi:formate/nitrite transporter FocA (FNT family)